MALENELALLGPACAIDGCTGGANGELGVTLLRPLENELPADKRPDAFAQSARHLHLLTMSGTDDPKGERAVEFVVRGRRTHVWKPCSQILERHAHAEAGSRIVLARERILEGARCSVDQAKLRA